MYWTPILGVLKLAFGPPQAILNVKFRVGGTCSGGWEPGDRIRVRVRLYNRTKRVSHQPVPCSLLLAPSPVNQRIVQRMVWAKIGTLKLTWAIYDGAKKRRNRFTAIMTTVIHHSRRVASLHDDQPRLLTED